MPNHYPFSLQPLSYGCGGLAPCLNRETVCNHYEHRHQQLCQQSQSEFASLSCCYQSWTLEQLLTPGLTGFRRKSAARLCVNPGGVYNHNLYWSSMTSCGSGYPLGELGKRIVQQYQTFAQFRQQFQASAMAVFGSGWTWLAVDADDRLHMINTANQEVLPLQRFQPLLIVDLWEHAYYLQYQYNRERYLDNWWRLVNWRFAESQYQASKAIWA